MNEEERKKVAINNAAWEKLALYALKPDPLFARLAPKREPLTPKQEKARQKRIKREEKAQKAHDKAVKNGATCDSDY